MIHVEVVTPQQTLLSCEATQVAVFDGDSAFAMLPRHQAIVSAMGAGKVKITKGDGSPLWVKIESEYIVEQHRDKVTILADTAEISN